MRGNDLSSRYKYVVASEKEIQVRFSIFGFQFIRFVCLLHRTLGSR